MRSRTLSDQSTNSSMEYSDVFTRVFPCLHELEKDPLRLLAEIAILRSTSFGRSVQILRLPHVGDEDRQINQETFSCSLNSFSISHSPAENELVLVGRLNKDKQPQTPIENLKLKSTESFISEELVPIAHEEVRASGRSMTKQAKYARSEEGKARRVEYNASDRARTARAKYNATDKARVARAKYEASEKARARRLKYLGSRKGRMNRPISQAKYTRSKKGKMAQKICSVRSYYYRAALKQGLSEKLAREKGEIAANKKRAELSSTFSPGPFIDHNA